MVEVVALRDPGLGNTSYLVDLGDGSALMVDPVRDPRPYLEVAGHMGLVIRHVAETHLHADFVSGARELVALGAELIAPRESRLAHPHRPVSDGDELTVGDLRLRVLATPGHTPEHVAYVLSDDRAVVTAFTGGTLMVGGVARPDLVSAELTEPLARQAYHSVRRLLDVLSASTILRPTHGGGSFCAAVAGESADETTVGEQRNSHPARLATDAGEFTDRLLADLGSYPSYFRRLRPVNQRGPEVYGVDLPGLIDISPADVHRWTVVDVRPIERFASGHVPGSISIELRDRFCTWLGWLFEADTPIAFVIDTDQDERELVRQSLTVGHNPPFARLNLDAWTAAGGALDTVRLVAANEIPTHAAIIDVRQRSEWDREHVDGASHIELAEFALGDARVEGPAVMHCGHGQRAMTAASLTDLRNGLPPMVTSGGPAEISQATHRR